MKGKDILVAFIVLVIIVAGILILNKKPKVTKVSLPSPTPSIQQQIQDKFAGLSIPQNTEQTELKDVSGGSGMGLATRSEILADLPTPPAGQSYQAWIGNGQRLILLGKLEMAKGGYILDYNSAKYAGYNGIVITLGGKHILEGSF